MAKVIVDYTEGNIDANAFKASLQEHKIPIDISIDKLIRKHEAGEF